MKSKVRLVLMLTGLALFGGVGIVTGQVARQADGLTIFFTGDGDAAISSCGCPTEDYGGMTRRAAFLDTLRSKGWEFLTVDAGGLAPFKPMTQAGRLKTQIMARAMATMDYDAITLGDVDLAPGPQFVDSLVDWLGKPIVATNYDLPGGGSERTRIVEVRGRKVGVLAFFDTTLASQVPWLTLDSWQAQRARVDALDASTDFLIALVHTPDSTAVERLGALYPGIDLLISAYQGRRAGSLYHQGAQGIVGVGSQGRYLGRVEVSFPTGAPRKIEAAYLAVRKEWGHRTSVDDLIAEYARRVKDVPAHPDDTEDP